MTETPPRIARIFHLGAFCVYVFTIVYSVLYINIPPPYPRFAYAGKAKFLTHWNLCLCGLYFGLCVVLNVFSLRALYRVRDYVFCAVSLPSCVFVASVFWGLYAFDRELIFPKDIERFYPNWTNHCSHTLIVITAICEALLYRHNVPSKLAGYSGILTWFGVYQTWVLYLGISRDIWVYPVMSVLSPLGRAVFFVACCVTVLLLHGACSRFLHLLQADATATTTAATTTAATRTKQA